MTGLRRALIWGIAAGREDDLLATLPISLPPADPETGEREPNVVQVTQPEGTFRFHYKRVVSEAGVDAVTIAGRPSSGDGERWRFYILQPEDRRRAVAREFRQRLLAWAAAHQPTGGGLYHLLGPYTPADFQALAPPTVWDTVVHSWWTIWSADGAHVAEQQALGDADLEDAD